MEWFPKYGLRKIDAVLITHAHADGTLITLYVVLCFSNFYILAMNGLDDLRGIYRIKSLISTLKSFSPIQDGL